MTIRRDLHSVQHATCPHPAPNKKDAREFKRSIGMNSLQSEDTPQSQL